MSSKCFTTKPCVLSSIAPTNPSVIFHRTPEPSTFPGPPSKPMVTDITEMEMKLAWKANANHGASPVVAYTVEYFSHETGDVSMATISKTQLTKCATMCSVAEIQ